MRFYFILFFFYEILKANLDKVNYITPQFHSCVYTQKSRKQVLTKICMGNVHNIIHNI